MFKYTRWPLYFQEDTLLPNEEDSGWLSQSV